jgi:hypothetical protein
VSAPSLQSVGSLASRRPLKLGEVLGVLRDAATALGALHAAGRAHGAVCAENIVLDDEGAARLCHDEPTPTTLSPEQQAGGEPDARSDVYGLGATIADLLADAGRPPEPLERLLAMMTAESPERRYQSMAEVLTALQACELMTGYQGFRPGREAQAARERRRLLYAVVLALGAVMLLLALFVALGPTPPPRGKPPASHKELLDQLVPLPGKPATGTRR